MKKVDLNVDIGEGFPFDEALLEFATSANVCCGEHAGSWELTLKTIELCSRKGTPIGMHPGFPDRESMGRRMPADEEIAAACSSISKQARAFIKVCHPAYLKPHGAWYNLINGPVNSPTSFVWQRANVHLIAFKNVLLVQAEITLPIMLLPGSMMSSHLSKIKHPIILEGFADRAYLPDGTLVPRTEPGAVLHDPEEIKAQVLRLAPDVDSICLHGDTPGCLEFAEMVRRTLEDAGYEVGY